MTKRNRAKYSGKKEYEETETNGGNGNGHSNGNGNGNGFHDSRTIVRKKIKLVALNQEQREVIRAIKENQIIFIHGLAGTGKTHLSVIYGLRELLFDKYDKLVFTRPCVEANGEKIGFLPGGYDDKIAPYMIPIFDIIGDKMSIKDMKRLIEEGRIKTLPFAYLRGVTFNKSFVVADEAQNTNPQQMRLLLSRIGKDSKIVITGDLSQSDISGKNGMRDAIERLTGISELAIIELTEQSMIRNPIITIIEGKYSEQT